MTKHIRKRLKSQDPSKPTITYAERKRNFVRSLLSKRLRLNGWRVLNALDGYMDYHSCTCYPSIPTLMKDLHIDKKAVQDGLRQLETWGVISRIRSTGRGHATLYMFIAGAEAPPRNARGKPS